MKHKWLDKEKEFIKLNAGILTDRQLAIRLSKMYNTELTMESVRKQRQKMGIKKKHGRGVCKLQEPKNNHAVGLTIYGTDTDIIWGPA
jgi:hypothetical protein